MYLQSYLDEFSYKANRRYMSGQLFSRAAIAGSAFIGNITDKHFILFCDYLYKGYLQLDETIRLGRRASSNMLEEMWEWEWELFSRAMIDISKTNFKEVASKITIPKSASKMLDLGGSHGLYSIELCRRNPGLKGIVVDLAPVKKYADECIAAYKVSDQVSYLTADFMKDEILSGIDVILGFNIIHGFESIRK